MDTPQRDLAYRQLLLGSLSQHLFSKGFSRKVPPFRPGKDLLSVVHFGVVRGGSSGEAYRLLSKFNLRDNYIHPLWIRQRFISRSQFSSRIVPTVKYQYSAVSWSLDMATWATRAHSDKDFAERTFIVLATDGRMNGPNARAENMDIARNAGPANYDRVRAVREEASRHVLFTNRDGLDEAAWSDTNPVPGEFRSAMHLEAYEVISKDIGDWESKKVRQEPFTGAQASWTNETAASPTLKIELGLSPEYVKWAGQLGQPSWCSIVYDAPKVHHEKPVTWPHSSQGSRVETELVMPGLLRTALDGHYAFQVGIRQRQAWLGTRRATYTWKRPLVLPVAPSTTWSSRFHVVALAIWRSLPLTLPLFLLGLWARQWWRFGQHLELEVPGVFAAIGMGRRDTVPSFHSLPPRPDDHACSLTLPPYALQWLLYPFSRLRLKCEPEGSLYVEGTHPESACHEITISLPYKARSVMLLWANAPPVPTLLSLEAARGARTNLFRIHFPAARTRIRSSSHAVSYQIESLMEHTPATSGDINQAIAILPALPAGQPAPVAAPRPDIFVALDLGSESMAACFRHTGVGGARATMIDLQRMASQLLGAGNNAEFANIKPRLRTRIGVRDQRQPQTIDPQHATLDLSEPEQESQCMFQYFFSESATATEARKLLPNPKIPFQMGARDIFPQVEATGSVGASGRQYVDMDAATVICHLISQVVGNFVLRDPELLKLGDFNLSRVHLTVTVPNVYSVTHKKTIEEHLKLTAGVAQVLVIYESDAVAYLPASSYRTIPTRTKAFFDKMSNDLIAASKLRDKSLVKHRLLVIDVGRGTTDLSVMELKDSHNAMEPRRQINLGRTGRSEGGNFLSFQFARYYESAVRRVFADYGPALVERNVPPFSLLKLAPVENYPSSEHAKALRKLESLIDAVKASLDERMKMRLDIAEQSALAEAVAGAYMESIVKDASGPDKPADPGEDASDEEKQEFQDVMAVWSKQEQNRTAFGSHLVQALVLEAESLYVNSLRSKLRDISELASGMVFRIKNGRSVLADDEPSDHESLLDSPAELRAEIDSYVLRNSTELIRELREMAHQTATSDDLAYRLRRGDSGWGSHCYVLVAGQAAQFKPLRNQINASFPKGTFIHFLDGPIAKEACCLGALEHAIVANELANPDYLFGVYGFRTNVMGRGSVDPEFKVIDPNELNEGKELTLGWSSNSLRTLLYTPRANSVALSPSLDDGMTAHLGEFQGMFACKVQYDKAQHNLLIEGERVPLASFGQVESNIWAKVWPDILPPKA